jgi:hypothetical protein
MPLYTLPIEVTSDAWEQTTELDGRTFRLSFAWSLREEAWYLDIASRDGTLLAAGLKLAEAVDVLRREASDELPPGPIVLLDMTGAHAECTRDDLGKRWVLFYGAP